MKFKIRNPKCETNSKLQIPNSKLTKLLPGIKRNVFLKNYTTFKIGGPAKYFFVAKTKEDLILAIKVAKKFNLPFFILGRGSNLLVSDEGFDGLIIKIKSQPQPSPKFWGGLGCPAPPFSKRAGLRQKSKVKSQNQKSKIIEVEAGMPLSQLVAVAFKNSLTGLEWAVGIPGTVGGAIYGNAGAFGKSMADITKTVTVLEIKNKKLKIKNFTNKDCKFNYRNSIFKENKDLIILSVILQLKKGNKKEIQEKMKKYLSYRKETQPLNFPSAGSIFKNPPGFAAGELIEKAGLKGKKIGNVKISEKHANFIVNLGKGKAKDVKKLIDLAKKMVKQKFGIVLKEEIEYLGFFHT